MDSVNSLGDRLVKFAGEQGFSLAGITQARDAPRFQELCRWLERGFAGSMEYIAKRREAYKHPNSVLPGAKSLLMLGMPYSPAQSLRKAVASPNGVRTGNGKVAAYAASENDYHDKLHQKMQTVLEWISIELPGSKARGVVDTAPLLERDFARLAGLGWIGKNTLLLNRTHGSYFFLAAVLVDASIAPPQKQTEATDHCGTCTACLDSCPTQAFPQPHVLDASRCISYLTIEHRGIVPRELRSGIGSHVFGCDICQQVCPWNRMAKETQEIELRSQVDMAELELARILELNESEFRARFRKTALWRTKQAGIARNALIVLGNQCDEASIPKISPWLSDFDVTLRATAAWALGQIGGEASAELLKDALSSEKDPTAREEIQAALVNLQALD